MAIISKLQMTDATSWKGLTTDNHIGAMWGKDLQLANDVVTQIQNANFGNDIDSILNRFETKEF